MKKISMLLTFALAACGAGSPDGGNSGTGAVTAEAGAVRGVAVDTQNRRLSGAEITVCNAVTHYGDACVNATTGGDGSYSLRLPSNNVWHIYGSITKSYNGATYCLPLAVDNRDSFSSTEGAIRNFSWKLSGVIPGQMDNHSAGSYFGASLSTVFDLYPNQVRVSFVPNGPLIDGSAGSSFSAIAGDWVSNSIGNIPIGAYTVRAEYLQSGGGVMPLRVSLTSTTGNLGASVTVQFPPDPASSCTLGPEARLYIAP
jgi:hypothetical protein